MSIPLRLSNKPYTAEVVFKNGKVRQIDYTVMQANNAVATFFENHDGSGPAVMIGLSSVETIELNDAAQIVGGKQ